MSNAVISTIVALLASLGANAYIIKYIIPSIHEELKELRDHRDQTLTKEGMKEILEDNNKFMTLAFEKLLLEFELKSKS